MANINFKKCGWIRTPEKDFSDDGNRFICYGLEGWGNQIRLSKCTYEDSVYISIQYQSNKTAFYKYFDELNGVSKDFASENIERVTKEVIDWLNNDMPKEDVIQEVSPEDLEDAKKNLAGGWSEVTNWCNNHNYIKDKLMPSDWETLMGIARENYKPSTEELQEAYKNVVSKMEYWLKRDGNAYASVEKKMAHLVEEVVTNYYVRKLPTEYQKKVATKVNKVFYDLYNPVFE